MTLNIAKTIRRSLVAIPIGLICLSVSGCLKDEDNISEEYVEWRDKNLKYLEEAEALTDENGNAYYERIVPSWATNTFALVHWYNDRSLTEKNLSPMDNSTVQITYELYNIDGDTISTSYASRDSLYTSKPYQNIIGVWAPLTQMHVGDSVKIVIPYQAGYGERKYGNIPPYSTLVYNIKLKAITAYEVP